MYCLQQYAASGNLAMLLDCVTGFILVAMTSQCCWRQYSGIGRSMEPGMMYIHTQPTASTSGLAPGISLPFP